MQMFRKTLISATAIVILAGISLFAAEKAKENKETAKPGQPSEMAKAERPNHPGALLDELIAAYKANDREKMGNVIEKMEHRRDQMRKFAQFERWHRLAHRREMMMHRGCGFGGPQWGRRGGPAFGGFNRGWQGGGCGCCPMNQRQQFGQQQQFRGNQNWGPGPQMRRPNPGRFQQQENWGPGGERPMRGFGHGWGDDQSFQNSEPMNENENDNELAESQFEPQFFADLQPDEPMTEMAPAEQDW